MRGKTIRHCVLAAVLVLALVLLAFASCGRGKHRQFTGAGFSGNPQSGIGGSGNSIGDGSGAHSDAGTKTIDQVLAEIRAYEPPQSAGVDPAVFETLRAELVRQIEDIAATRGVSSFPVRSVSADRDDEVGLISADISVIPQISGVNAVHWSVVLEGDFDGSFEVNVADITPIAINYGKQYGDSFGGLTPEQSRFLVLTQGDEELKGSDNLSAMANDGYTEMGIGKITTIAKNYLHTLPAGYDVWRIPIVGGVPDRILNQTGTNLPTVLQPVNPAPGKPIEIDFNDPGPAQASSLRGASGITPDGAGWSNGDFYYWIEARRAKDVNTPPIQPSKRLFNAKVTYRSHSRVQPGEDVVMMVDVYGEAVPVSYGVNWGDGTTEVFPVTGNPQHVEFLPHKYMSEGTYTPIVAIEVTFDTVPPSRSVYFQEAPPVEVYSDIPDAPVSLTASAIPGGVHLDWTPVNPQTGDEYYVFWSLRNPDSRPTEFERADKESTSFDDLQSAPLLKSGQTIFYWVTAKRGNRESGYSDWAKWPPLAIEAPVVSLDGTSSETQVDLSWPAVPDNLPDYSVAGYNVYKEAAPSDPNALLVSGASPITQTAFTYLPQAGEESLYFFATTVTAGAEESGRSNEVVWTIGAPAPPTNPVASAGYRWIQVDWQASVSPGIVDYLVTYYPAGNPSEWRSFLTAGTTYKISDDRPTATHPVSNETIYNLTVEARRGGMYSILAGPVTASPVNTPPVAGFVVDKTSGGAPLVVNFNAATGSPKSTDPDGKPMSDYEWDFDGNGVYNEDLPGTDDELAARGSATFAHTYDSEGVFTPKLRVKDEEGAPDTYTGVPITTVPGAPVALATANPISGDMPLTVDFDATGSSDPDGGSISDYEWDFDGDGVFDEGALGTGSELDARGYATPQFTFTTWGDYPASVRVTDDDQGLKATDSVNTAIHVNAPPVADLTADPPSGNAPLTVNFDASGSYDLFGTITKYEFDFGEGDGWQDNGAVATIQHTYDNPGSFPASVRVTDNDGGTDTASSQTIVVNTPPIAALSADPMAGYIPLNVSFDASGSSDSDGTIAKYEFDFGEGGGWQDNGTTATIQHTYDNGGDFTASVRVTDNSGAQDTASVHISANAQGDWWMFGRNALHTRRSPFTGPATNALKWSYTTGSYVSSSPVVGADGTVYVGSYDGKFYAIYPGGSLKWAYTAGGSIYSSPAIGVDGTVYVGCNDNNLYAIKPAGSLKWAYTTGGMVQSSPTIGADGTVYVGSRDNKLYAINANGSLKWNYATGNDVDSAPAIGADGTVYVGSRDNKLYAINADGSFKWSYTTGGAVWSSPAIGADGTVYVGSDDTKLYAVNPDGSLKWAYVADLFVRSSPAIGADGTVYVGCAGGKLYAINPDGSFKWLYTTGAAVYSSPAIGADGTVYVGSTDWNLYAINPGGSLKWSRTTGKEVEFAPAIGADGTVYVGSNDYKLYAIGPGGG